MYTDSIPCINSSPNVTMVIYGILFGGMHPISCLLDKDFQISIGIKIHVKILVVGKQIGQSSILLKMQLGFANYVNIYIKQHKKRRKQTFQPQKQQQTNKINKHMYCCQNMSANAHALNNESN